MVRSKSTASSAGKLKSPPPPAEVPERGRSKPGPRALLVRNSIVESAAKSFAEKGFSGTTMEDVARESGFAASSLYSYFLGKEDLFVATLEMIADRVLGAFDDPLLRELSFVERVAWLFRRVCQVIQPNQEFFVLLFGQAPFIDWNASSPSATVGKRVYRQFIQRFAKELEAGMNEGALAKTDALDLSYVIAGAFQSWVFRWIHGDMPDGLQPSLTRFLARIRPLLEAP